MNQSLQTKRKAIDIPKQKRGFKAKLKVGKILASFIILLLAIIDFFTLFVSFADALPSLEYSELIFFCGAIVVCLEGLPLYLGIALCEHRDEKSIVKKDKKVSLTILILGTIVVIGMFILVIWQRLSVPMIGATAKDKLAGNINPLQYIIAFLPVFNSVIVFIAAWIGLASDVLEKQEKKVDFLYRKYEQYNNAFQVALGELRNARVSLWTALDATAKVPKKLHEFYKKIYNKARSKLIEDSLIVYDTQLEIFNLAVKEELGVIIHEMAERSTIPRAIEDVKLDDVIREYDALQEANDRPEDIWSHNKSIETLKNELRQVLDNAVIVAQSKTHIYFPLEEEQE